LNNKIIIKFFDRAQAVYGPYDEWFTDIQGNSNAVNRTNRMADRITEFMKIQKKCPIGTSGCFSTGKMLTFTGQVYEENDSLGSSSYTAPRFILSDGTSIAFHPTDTGPPLRNYVGHIMVEIDGPNKGKNQDGYDRFTFIIANDSFTIHPGGSLNLDRYSGQGNFDYTYAEYSLASWVLLNGNMDYFKCNDLNWQTKTSCK